MKRCPNCNSVLEERNERLYCPFCETYFSSPKESPKPSPVPAPSKNDDGKLTAHEIWERCRDGVLRLSSAHKSGSGFLIDETKRYALTNTHVITGEKGKYPATSGYVNVDDEREIPYTVKKYNERLGSFENDIALLQLKEIVSPMKALPLAKNLPQVGEDVFSIGNPLDRGVSLSKGIISRYVTDSNNQVILFLSDVAVNSGSSGSPLSNDRGEVVGICVSSARGSDGSATEGMHYFIPIQRALKYVGIK